jgi:hypothetical protein
MSLQLCPDDDADRLHQGRLHVPDDGGVLRMQ